LSVRIGTAQPVDGIVSDVVETPRKIPEEAAPT